MLLHCARGPGGVPLCRGGRPATFDLDKRFALLALFVQAGQLLVFHPQLGGDFRGPRFRILHQRGQGLIPLRRLGVALRLAPQGGNFLRLLEVTVLAFFVRAGQRIIQPLRRTAEPGIGHGRPHLIHHSGPAHEFLGEAQARNQTLIDTRPAVDALLITHTHHDPIPFRAQAHELRLLGAEDFIVLLFRRVEVQLRIRRQPLAGHVTLHDRHEPAGLGAPADPDGHGLALLVIEAAIGEEQFPEHLAHGLHLAHFLAARLHAEAMLHEVLYHRVAQLDDDALDGVAHVRAALPGAAHGGPDQRLQFRQRQPRLLGHRRGASEAGK